jgi:hypothetical protein
VDKPLRLRLAAISAVTIIFAALTSLTAAYAANCTGSDRTVTVTNKSGQTIWVAALGSTQTKPPDPATCSSNSACQANEFCDPTVMFCRSVPLNGQITYDDSSSCTINADCSSEFPICYTGNGKCGTLADDGNGFELANEGSHDICVPTTWGGRLWARTGCSFTQNSNTTCSGRCEGQTVMVGSACATTADCKNACVGGSNNGLECINNSLMSRRMLGGIRRRQRVCDRRQLCPPRHLQLWNLRQGVLSIRWKLLCDRIMRGVAAHMLGRLECREHLCERVRLSERVRGRKEQPPYMHG